VIVVSPRAKALAWDELEKFVHNGGKLLALSYEELPGSFCAVETKLSNQPVNISHLRAPFHPILSGLTVTDTRFWADDYKITFNSMKRPHTGNFKILSDAGMSISEGKNGLVLAPLVEIRGLKGTAVFAQIFLVDKLGQEPVAAWLLHNILKYLQQVDPTPLKPIGILDDFNFGKIDPETLNITTETLAPDKLAAVFVDGSAPDLADKIKLLHDRLQTYIKAGGTLFIHKLTPENTVLLEPFAGISLQVQPVQRKTLFISPEIPSLWGISHYELMWREPGGFGKVLNEAVIQSYEVTSLDKKVTAYVKPGAYLEIPQGKGKVVIDQVEWDKQLTSDYLKHRAAEYISQLLTNLNIRIKPKS
jgi:hypothetical protein